MKVRLFTMVVLALFLTSMRVVDIQSAVPQQTDQTNLVVLDFDFPSLSVTEGPVYDSVKMQGLPQHGAPGEPILPFKTVKILIPQGKDVQSVDVTASNRKVLKDTFHVEYGKTPIPFSTNITVEDQANQAIYCSANPFPCVLFSQKSEHYFRGYKILTLRLHPVQYVPKTSELSYFERMTVTAKTIVGNNVSPLFRNLQRDKELVSDIVDNPSEVESYTETTKLAQHISLANPSDLYDYVIITKNTLKSSFQLLIDWKIQKGLNATIVSVEDIMNDSDYDCDGSFGDGCGTQLNGTQAHVRNFIKDAYMNWGTEYVLLGGDDEIIPARGVYAYTSGYYLGSGEADYNMSCDMYYGALDGSWDNDNDTTFGEGVCHDDDEGPENGTAGEEADFFAEVYIGRAPVDTPQEATNFVRKTLVYEQNPNASYLKKALMIGQTLDAETEGGNGKDLVTDIIPQYTTTRLYSRDGTFNHSAVINEMNSGTHIVNDNGHANYNTVMGLCRSDVDNLTNTDYFMAYSIGCYSAAFDSATSGIGEAIGEHFITSNGGAFAYIGNSRYGLYLPGLTDGPGDRYDRSFFEVLSNGTRNLGKALQLSKENLFDEFVDRWTYFNLNLLGDPETEIVASVTAPTAHFETRTDLLTPANYGETVIVRGIAKRGTAAASSFSNYTIEYGVGTSPTFWSTTGVNLTDNGQSEVVNGILGIWNTSLVDDGTYTLMMTVTDAGGNVGKDWTVITISRQYTLTICSLPTGITFTVDGLPHMSPWSETYGEGALIGIEMPEIHNCYVWSHWLEDGDPDRIKVVTMETNITLTAVFAFTFDVVLDDICYPVSILSNSTISNFDFNKTEMQISFDVTGGSDTTGYCNVTIPNSLLKGNPWKIKINSTTTTSSDEKTNNTHTFLYFTYTHESLLHVTIEGTWVVPEFPLTEILPLFMVLSLIAVVFIKHKKKKQ